MIRSLFLPLILIIFSLPVEAKTYLLVAGVSNYGNDMLNLSQTTKDAKNFKDLMEHHSDEAVLITSKHVTHDNLLDKLKKIGEIAGPEDRIMFFYSGHGMPGGMCTYDRPVYYKELVDVLSGSEAKEKICFIDACFAGSITEFLTLEDWMNILSQKKDMAFIMGSRPDETSKESPQLGAGYLTQALIKGIRGKADKDDNREITLMELFRYVYGDVLKRSGSTQHPQLIAAESLYDIVIAKWDSNVETDDSSNNP